MRKEKYMIHQYKLNGYNIVLDVCSGSVHVVDEAAYDSVLQKYRVFDVFHVYENIFSSSLQGIPSLSIVN